MLGGAVAAILSPRASFAVAGFGVLLVLAAAAVALNRVGWRGDKPPPEDLEDLPPPPFEAIDPDGVPTSARLTRRTSAVVPRARTSARSPRA